MDMSTIAIIATILFCSNGPLEKNDRCDDGLAPTSYTVTILRQTNNEMTSVLEIRKGKLENEGQLLFKFNIDGSSESSNDFRPDLSAQIFLQAVRAILVSNNLKLVESR